MTSRKVSSSLATLMVTALLSGVLAKNTAAQDNSSLPVVSLAPQVTVPLPPLPKEGDDAREGNSFPQRAAAVTQKQVSMATEKKYQTSLYKRINKSGEDGADTYEAGHVLDPPTVVMPEVTTTIKLSSSDVNRFVCSSGEIDDVPLSSEEKGVVIKSSGKEAFVKFKVLKRGDGKLSYSTTPTEIFIVCGGETYSVIAFPSRVPSQTIKLGNGLENKIKENRSLYSGLPFEKRIMRIIKEVYTDNIPESYTVTKRNIIDRSWKDMTITLKREVDVEGEGLHLKEFIISLKAGQPGPIKLTEKMFLRKEFAINPIGVSIDKHKLQIGDVARLFIVEQRAEQPLGGNGLQLMSIDSATDGDTPAAQSPAKPDGYRSPSAAVRGAVTSRSRMPQQMSEGAE